MMLWTVVAVLALLSPIWLLWPLYIYAIKFEDGQHPGRKAIYYVTAIIDIIMNWSVLILYLLDVPRGKAEGTFTKHIARLRATDTGWRGAFSTWICRRMLDPYAPNGCHC